MVKQILFFSICYLIISMFSFTNADSYVWSDARETMLVIPNNVDLKLDVESAILMDEDTGTILYTKNEHEKLRPASVTKVMSLLLIMEALDNGTISLTDNVPCSTKAREMGGSQIWLDETEQLTVHEMLKAICVVSANDCTVAMAEFIGGSEEVFVGMMNEKAKELGMNDTTYKNCHGIDEDGHLTSAWDIAIVSRELSKNHSKIHEYTKIWMDTLRDGKSELVNTNKLIRFYSGATGLKTGSTSLAMFNLAATATRNDMNLIAVVMKGSTSQKRFDDAKTLLDYGFANYTSQNLCKRGDIVQTIEIAKAKINNIDLIISEDRYALLGKADGKNITKEVHLNENISAPLEYNEKIGYVEFLLNGEPIEKVDIVSNEKVEKKGFISFDNELIDFWYRSGR